MKAFVRYALARLSERSTVAGMVMLLTSIGINIHPDLADAIGSAATGLAGLGLALMPTGGVKD